MQSKIHKQHLFLLMFSTFMCFIVGCNNKTADINIRPDFRYYDSYGYARNTPFNYIAFKKDHIYIMRKGFSFFDESVIEIPLDKDTVNKNDIIKNICCYQFDIDTWNGQFGKRSFKDRSKNRSELRNVTQYIFEFELPKTPVFNELKIFNKKNSDKYNKHPEECKSYLIYLPNTQEAFWICSCNKFSAQEKEVLNWLSFVREISFVDAMYYDQSTGNHKHDFMEYPELKDYVIPSENWKIR